VTERIQISPKGGGSYSVSLNADGVSTDHEVGVPPDLLSALGLGSGDEQRLVRASFEFLLEREGPESILGRFDLDVIGRYFPDYVTAVAEKLAPSPPDDESR
jgi:hypothetical protein